MVTGECSVVGGESNDAPGANKSVSRQTVLQPCRSFDAASVDSQLADEWEEVGAAQTPIVRGVLRAEPHIFSKSPVPKQTL